MNPFGRWLLAVALVLACVPAAQAKAKRPAAAAPDVLTETLRSGMVFYLAKGEPNSCGQGCSQWIAAEGTIATGTGARLRAFLKRQSGKRPIYFYSPGGITSDAVSMGRLLREYGLTARVARTIPQGCETDAKECANGKRSGRELSARLTSSLAQCNSACVYALVGARVREIAPEAHLGVHASKTVIVGKLPPGVKVPAEMRTNFKAEHRQQIRRYLAEMGIQPALLDVAEKIPHESIKALTRGEMVRFGIDTRNFVESGWIYDDRITDRGGIFKSFETESGGAEYRRTLLRLSCLGKGQFLLGYAREVGPKENSFRPVKIVAAKEEFKLTPPQEPVASGDNKKFYDVRRVWMPMQAFESAATEGRIEVAADAAENKPGVKLSTVGLASALSSLTQRCGQSVDVPALGGAALVPHHSP